MTVVIDLLSWALLLAGGFFIVVGAIGINRMPDVFTRMHAASVSDTLGAGFLLIGMMLQAGFSLVTVKLIVIFMLLFFQSPLATHALTQAALYVGLKPLLAKPGKRLAESEAEPEPMGPGLEARHQEAGS
ncbi:MAG: monovalent cation/H(+) antiporter subunit G [Hyphomicrobiales bacterium]|nr:monovalent cation/H(+) antiporter subunit G [Hyphomicrobiales bacterium]